MRPFGKDGLAGSSRPLPDTGSDFTVGPRTYTWHRQLALDAEKLRSLDVKANSSMQEVEPVALPAVWTAVDPDEVAETSRREGGAASIPPYDQCFQW